MLLAVLLSLVSPAAAWAADAASSGTDPVEPTVAPVAARPTDPGPLWSAYTLEPGPRGEPVAYVQHPRLAAALLTVETVELPACQRGWAACRDDAATEGDRLTQELATARAAVPPVVGAAVGPGEGSGAAWGERLSWGMGGVALGVVGGVALVLSL